MLEILTNYYADASLLEVEGASSEIFPPSPSKCLITAPDPYSKPAVTPCPLRGHTPGYSPTELLSMLLPRMDGPHQLIYWRIHSIFSGGLHPWHCCGRTTKDRLHQQTGPYVDHWRYTQTPRWGRYWWSWETALYTPWFPRSQGSRAWALLWPAHIPPLGQLLLGGFGNAHGRSCV